MGSVLFGLCELLVHELDCLLSQVCNSCIAALALEELARRKNRVLPLSLCLTKSSLSSSRKLFSAVS